MIKLIASDIDGTLLPKGQKTIDEDTLRVVSEILDNGIEFCAISGRPRNSVMNLFAPVADRIWDHQRQRDDPVGKGKNE